MTKLTFENNLNYIFNPERKNAKYSLNGGETYMNHGEYCECLCKSVLGYEAHKDANTAFDKGDDIPEMKASVKSWRCGLTDCKDMPKNPEDFMKEFWIRDHSENFIWVYDYADMVDLWIMNRNEFKAFVNEFAVWDNHCTKFRITICNNKINTWLEAHI